MCVVTCMWRTVVGVGLGKSREPSSYPQTSQILPLPDRPLDVPDSPNPTLCYGRLFLSRAYAIPLGLGTGPQCLRQSVAPL